MLRAGCETLLMLRGGCLGLLCESARLHWESSFMLRGRGLVVFVGSRQWSLLLVNHAVAIWFTLSWTHVEVTVPGARPPAESKQQVMSRKKGKTCCFFHGNKAWASECRRFDIMFRQVSHQDHEYAKRVATTPFQLSNWGGTQAMDRWWLALKKFIPPSLNRKKAAVIPASLTGKEATVVHPHVALLLFQWGYRMRMTRGKSPREVLEALAILF
eukprot:Skav225860  [mRNA]  locus=scaffold810:104597:105238:+ [translate_table: standard]